MPGDSPAGMINTLVRLATRKRDATYTNEWTHQLPTIEEVY